jgi:hypothetical protein
MTAPGCIAGDWTGEIRVWSAADAKRIGHLSTNPRRSAERMAAESKALAEAKAAAPRRAACEKTTADVG